MKEIHFGEFRSYVRGHIREIEKYDYEKDSIEWFLLRYLRRIVKCIEAENSAGRVEGAMRALLRFYIDNIDKKSELGDQCVRIYDRYRLTIRENQSS